MKTSAFLKTLSLVLVFTFGFTSLTWAAGPSFVWLSPTSGSTKSGVVKIEGKATPDASGTSKISKWCLQLNGASITEDSTHVNGLTLPNTLDYWTTGFDSSTGCFTNSSDSLSSGTFSYDTTTWANGTYTFQVTITDSSGRTATSNVLSIVTNNPGPSFVWLSPTSGSTKSGVVKIEGKATPDASGTSKISKWCLQLNGASITEDSTHVNGLTLPNTLDYWTTGFDSSTGCFTNSSDSLSSGTFSYDTTTWANGTYTFQVTITDSSGRTATSNVLSIVTNNPGPSFVWLSPTSGSTKSGVVKIEGKATPDASGTSKISKWCLQLNGASITEDSTHVNGLTLPNTLDYWTTGFDSSTGCFTNSSDSLSSGTFSYDTTTWANGTYTFQVTITDSSGRTATSNVLSIVTNNPGPSFVWLSPTSGSTKSGVVKIEGKATPDASGTSKISKWCLQLNGASITEDSTHVNGLTLPNTLDYWTTGFDSSTGCFTNSSDSLSSGTFSYDFTNIIGFASYFNTALATTLTLRISDSALRTIVSDALVVTAENGQLTFSVAKNSASGVPNYAPMPVQGARTTSSTKATWSAAPAGTPAATSYKVRISTNGGSTWTTQTVTSPELLIDGLNPASARLIQVAAVNGNGQGPWGQVVVLTSKGARANRVTVVDSNGNPVSGGKITWSMVDEQTKSSKVYGLTADGAIDFPATPAGWVEITISDALLQDGTYVSGTTTEILGLDSLTIKLPEHAPAYHQVRVTLPESGYGASGVDVYLGNWDYLENTYSIDGFEFSVPQTIDSGKTNQFGYVTLVGFKARAGTGSPDPITVYANYDDGVINQTKHTSLRYPETNIELDYVPWMTFETASVSGSFGEAIPVTISLEDAFAFSALSVGWLRTGLLLINPLVKNPVSALANGATVKLIPPAGAKTGGCGNKGAKAKLSGNLNSSGVAKLKVCANISGTYSLSGTGAASVGSLLVKVKGAPPLPVTSLTAKSPSVGTISASWNLPSYNGGAKVLDYTVKITGAGKTIKKVIKSRQISVSGLSSAVTYTFTITARTKYGSSTALVAYVPVA